MIAAKRKLQFSKRLGIESAETVLRTGQDCADFGHCRVGVFGLLDSRL
jgi:hypothetical protein